MSSQKESIYLRPATAQDLPFIEQMGYEAAFPEPLGDRLPFDEVRQQGWFQTYTSDWPQQEGDFGLIAEDADRQPLGAAWYRDYPREDLPDYIPTHEVSIALIPEARGRRIGQQLLSGLLAGAKQNGVDMLMLQVLKTNQRARALYNKVGFKTVAETNQDREIMVALLPPTPTQQHS